MIGPLRVGIVCPYSFAVPGGVQFHIRDFGRELERRGHHVAVLAPGIVADGTPDFVRGSGRSIALPYNGSIARIAFTPGSARTVREWIDDGRFDVLHLHQPDVPSLSMQALRVARGPIVATYHAAREQSMAMQMAAPIVNRGMDRIGAHIAVSQEAREFVDSHTDGRYPIEIVPNGVFVDDFARAPRDPQLVGRPGQPTIAFLGRMTEPRKGLSVLLRALPAIVRAIPGARFLIAGPGAEDGSELAQAALPELAGRLEFLGTVSDERKASLFASADLYVAPHTGGESFGIVLCEAMAAGTCVLASDLDSFRDVLGDGRAGVLFRNGDSDDLAAKAIALLCDPAARARCAEAGQARVRRYDWSVVADRVLAIYERVLAGVRASHRDVAR